MFLPIGDQPNPRCFTPVVNYVLIGINVAVFVLVTLPLSNKPADPADPMLQEYIRVVGQNLPPNVNIGEVVRQVSAYDLFVIMRYVPLTQRDKALMLDKFVSVSRATLKGTIIVGIVQGGLAGLAFAVVGIQGAAFWGTVMVVLSIIPGVGTALVWVPAVLYLFAVGRIVPAVGLLLWCALVVGTVDNFLRPILVGKHTEMPDLLILLSTLGGLFMFGAVGFVIGPIVAALFVAVWRIYADTFGDVLLEARATESEG